MISNFLVICPRVFLQKRLYGFFEVDVIVHNWGLKFLFRHRIGFFLIFKVVQISCLRVRISILIANRIDHDFLNIKEDTFVRGHIKD